MYVCVCVCVCERERERERVFARVCKVSEALKKGKKYLEQSFSQKLFQRLAALKC